MIFNAYTEQKESVAGLSVVSCGHIFAKPGREILRPHGRQDWLLFYIVKESETFFFGDRVTASAGSFVLFAPGEKQHHRYEGSKTGEFYYVHFRCETLPPHITLQTSRVYSLPPKRQYCDLFEELIEEVLQKSPCYEALCACRLLTLLTLLEREVIHTSHPMREQFERIARVVQHMNRYYNSEMDLAGYAALCGMSKHHFLRVFEQVTGKTPLHYRNEIRMEHAAELLLEERLSVAEIGERLGFSSPAYFSAAFKKAFGYSPKQYQSGAK